MSTTPGGFSSATADLARGGGGRGRRSGGENDVADKEVAVLVIQVESPNVLYVRKTPLSAEERSFLRAMAEYCGRLNAASSSFSSSSSSSGWRGSLNDRRLNVGEKYLALDSRPGGSEWRRALLTNVVTVRGGHRACVYLTDEARSIDVALNQLLPMPEVFARSPPLLRKVIVAGIRPCSLVTDPLTCRTDYGPTDEWDSAAMQYTKKLFLRNPALSDVRLRDIRLHPETQSCFADLSFYLGEDKRPVSSYASLLKFHRFAVQDDPGCSFAMKETEIGKPAGPSGGFSAPDVPADSPLTLVSGSGDLITYHKPYSPSDKNNNSAPLLGSQEHLLMEEEALKRYSLNVPRSEALPPAAPNSAVDKRNFQITFSAGKVSRSANSPS